jgi:hypothetical protein
MKATSQTDWGRVPSTGGPEAVPARIPALCVQLGETKESLHRIHRVLHGLHGLATRLGAPMAALQKDGECAAHSDDIAGRIEACHELALGAADQLENVLARIEERA